MSLLTHIDGDDASLVRRMAAGDKDAHGELYERHGRAVFAFVLGRVGDRALAEEIFQESMLQAWHSAVRFRGDSRVLTWLLAIAHYQAASSLRRGRRENVADSSVLGRQNGASPPTGAIDLRIDLEKAMASLPVTQQAALELVFFHGLTVEEAAVVLDVAPGTVKSRLFRAKAALQPRLSTETPHV